MTSEDRVYGFNKADADNLLRTMTHGPNQQYAYTHAVSPLVYVFQIVQRIKAVNNLGIADIYTIDPRVAEDGSATGNVRLQLFQSNAVLIDPLAIFSTLLLKERGYCIPFGKSYLPIQARCPGE